MARSFEAGLRREKGQYQHSSQSDANHRLSEWAPPYNWCSSSLADLQLAGPNRHKEWLELPLNFDSSSHWMLGSILSTLVETLSECENNSEMRITTLKLWYMMQHRQQRSYAQVDHSYTFNHERWIWQPYIDVSDETLSSKRLGSSWHELEGPSQLKDIAIVNDFSKRTADQLILSERHFDALVIEARS